MSQEILIYGALSLAEQQLVNSRVDSTLPRVSAETMQMGSFNKPQMLVVKQGRTGLDTLAEYLTAIDDGVDSHAVFVNEPSDTDYQRSDSLALEARLKVRGVTIHDSLDSAMRAIGSIDPESPGISHAEILNSSVQFNDLNAPDPLNFVGRLAEPKPQS